MDRRLLALLSFSVIALGLVVLVTRLLGSDSGPSSAVLTSDPAVDELPVIEPLTSADAAGKPTPTPPDGFELAFDFPDETDELIPEPQQGPPAPPPPEAVYTGVLGSLGPNEQIVAPAADPPPAVAAGVSPLTGTASASAGAQALVAKIDNAEAGRPQAGIADADVVVEEMVEGGITRLAAIFQTSGQALGPIRSARTTDIAILVSLNRPLLAWSGANSLTASLVLAQPIVDRGLSTGAAYVRSTGRPAPHNLMTDVASIRAGATGTTPPTQFAFRSPEDELLGTETAGFAVDFPAVSVGWQWDGQAWARTQNGSAHVDAAGVQVRAENVIVQVVRYGGTGMADTSGAAVKEALSVGTGRAWIYTQGRVIRANWTKPSLAAVTTFTDGAGNHIPLTPGRTWIELAPPSAVG